MINAINFAGAAIKLQRAIESDYPEFSEHAEYFDTFDFHNVYIVV